MSPDLNGASDRYPEGFLDRTRLLLGDADVDALREKTVAVAGLGGVGGAAAITLARMGIGRMTLADPGVFDPPDANRQWAASCSTMGRNKADVYRELLADIAPTMALASLEAGVTMENLDRFIDGADLLIDGLDLNVPLPLRFALYARARDLGIHCISSPVIGTGTLTMIGAPGGMGLEPPVRRIVELATTRSRLPAGFHRFFFAPNVAAMEASIKSRGVPSCAVAVCFSAAHSCAQALAILLGEGRFGRPGPACLPEVTVLEPMGARFRVARYEDLFLDESDAPDGPPPGPAPADGPRGP